MNINVGVLPKEDELDWYRFLACLKFKRKYEAVQGFERKYVKNLLGGLSYVGGMSTNMLRRLQISAVTGGYTSYKIIKMCDGKSVVEYE